MLTGFVATLSPLVKGKSELPAGQPPAPYLLADLRLIQLRTFFFNYFKRKREFSLSSESESDCFSTGKPWPFFDHTEQTVLNKNVHLWDSLLYDLITKSSWRVANCITQACLCFRTCLAPTLQSESNLQNSGGPRWNWMSGEG